MAQMLVAADGVQFSPWQSNLALKNKSRHISNVKSI
jgi:hypothetical protein